MARRTLALSSSCCLAGLVIFGCIGRIQDPGDSDLVTIAGNGAAGAAVGGNAGAGMDHAGSAGSAGLPDAGIGMGISGPAGASGAGGSSGSAGSSGLGGVAGQAGTGPQAGTQSQSGASSGGTSAAGGAAGTGGALEHKLCEEECTSKADCTVFGSDQGYDCDPATRRCEKPGDPCANATECLPVLSLWFFDCTSDMQCFFFTDEVCVDVAGAGKCARLAPDSGCSDPTPDAVSLPRLGRPESVLVCANAGLVCQDGSCVPGCHVDDDCTPENNGSLCDQATGLCKCVDDADCGGEGVSHCDIPSGVCQCASNEDCEGIPNANTCAAGRCGCSAASVCQSERVFSGTRYVCE